MHFITTIIAFALAGLAFALPAGVSLTEALPSVAIEAINEVAAPGIIDKAFSAISANGESFGCHTQSPSMCTFTTGFNHADDLVASHLYDNSCNLKQKRYGSHLDIIYGQLNSATFLDFDVDFLVRNGGGELNWSFHDIWYKSTDCDTILGITLCRGQFECSNLQTALPSTERSLIPLNAVSEFTSPLTYEIPDNNTSTALTARWIPANIPLSLFCKPQPSNRSGWVSISSFFEKGLTNIYLFNWDCSVLINQFLTIMPPGVTTTWQPYPRPSGNGCAVAARVETDGNGIKWTYRGRGYYISGTPACWGYGAAVICRGEFETATVHGVGC